MKKLIIILSLMIPLLVQAQIGVWQIKGKTKTNTNVPAGQVPKADGTGKVDWGEDDDTPESGDLGIIDTEAKFESELFPILTPGEVTGGSGGWDTPQALAYSTDPVFDVSVSNTQTTTFSGDIDTLYLSNLADGEAFRYEITQDVIGGYGIEDIYMSGMTIVYIPGKKPTGVNLNDSGSNEKAVVYGERIGSIIYIYFKAKYTSDDLDEGSTNLYTTASEKSTWNGKQDAITLTTTGTSGAATLNSGTLNIPQYSGGSGNDTLYLPIRVGYNESAALTTGTSKETFRMPVGGTLHEVRANVATAPTGANLNIDINEAGTSVFSTVLSIDATEKTSKTATAAVVISDSYLADDAEITVDIDQVGSTFAGAGLELMLKIEPWTTPPVSSYPEFVALETYYTSPATSITVNKPTGTVEGDLMIFHLNIDTESQTINTLSGWTQIFFEATGITMTSAAYYKIAGASEPSDYTFDGWVNDRVRGTITTYRGVDQSTPIGNYSVDTSGTTSVSATSITATENSLLIFRNDYDTSGGLEMATTPSGMTVRSNDVVANNIIICDEEITDAGATGDRTGTSGGSGNSRSFLININGQ